MSDRFTAQIRQDQLNFINEASSVVIYTGEMESNLYQSLIFLNAIRENLGLKESDYSTVQELPPVKELKIEFESELKAFESSLTNLERVLGAGEGLPEDVHNLKKSYEVYKSIANEWLKLGEEDFEQANLMFITSIEPYFRNNIIPQISDLRSFVLLIQEVRNQELNESLKKGDIANDVATILSILMAIVLAVYIYKSIANPLINLNTAVTKFGEGNLNERIEISSKDELGELADAFNEMARSLEQKTVSKEYVDNIIESMHEAIFVTDADRKLTKLNSAAFSLLEYPADEIISHPLDQFFDFKEMNTPKSREFYLLKKNNGKIPVLYSEAELIDTTGQKVGSVVVASDISQQKNMEEELRNSLREKEVMLAEIHHRVKNNLAVISGLLQLQSFNAENTEVEKALTDSQLRIQSIALVHEMLYENDSLAYIQYDSYINELLQAISNMHISDNQEIELISDVEPIKLTINQAIPCSLLLNELVVNSLKLAFKEDEAGKIVVSLRQTKDVIVLSVADTGTAFDPEKFNSAETLGSTLIKTLTSQLKGSFDLLPNMDGNNSRFRVTFKIEG